jgi:signal recognition particle GTPase
MRYHLPMFDRLTAGLTRALDALSGRGYLSEDNIADTVREVRLALLDADVALPVVKSFTEAIKSRAVGRGGHQEPDARDRPSSRWCTRSSCVSWASRARA